MAKYGAKYVKWAPFADSNPDENSTAYPKYGKAISLGKLMSVAENPTFISGKIYGDNGLDESVDEFSELNVDVGVTELANDVAAPVLGASLGTGQNTDLEHGADDDAPYGGMAFYVNKLVKRKKQYQGIYYPKLKASMQGETFETKGNNLNLTGGALKFTGSASANGKWKVKSRNFDTEAEAIAWVDAKFTSAG